MDSTETKDELQVVVFDQAAAAAELIKQHYGPLLALGKGGKLAIDDKTKAALEHLKAEYGDLSQVDASTETGYAFLKNGIKRLTGYRTGVDKRHKEVKAPLLTITRVLDGTKNQVVAEIEAIEKPMKAAKQTQDEAEKRKKEERLARLDAKIRNEITCLLIDARSASSEAIAGLMDRLDKINPDEDYYDRTSEAHKAKQATMAELERLFSDKFAYEQAEKQREEEAEKRRELERKQLVDANINKLKAAPLDYMGKPSHEIRAAIATFSAELKQGAFGDRHAEALEAQKVALAQLEQMEKMQLVMEAQQEPEIPQTKGAPLAIDAFEEQTDPDSEQAAQQQDKDGGELHDLPNVLQPDEPEQAPRFAPPIGRASRDNSQGPIYADVTEEIVTISKREYDELLAESRLLAALVAHGVEDWAGYKDAKAEFDNRAEFLNQDEDFPF